MEKPFFNHYTPKSLVNKVIEYAKTQVPSKEASLLIKFIELYFSQTSSEDVEDRSVEELFGIVRSHWDLMQSKKKQPLKIQLFNPDLKKHGWESPHTILQVAINDMPFLVDSLRMELNRRGSAIFLMIYMGGMRILRNEKGEIVDIFNYESDHDDASIESPIFMEISRQTDRNILKDIQDDLIRVIDDVKIAVSDWRKMQLRMRNIIKEMANEKMPQNKVAIVQETRAFLEWLLNDHFTFLGARDYEVVGSGRDMALRLIEKSGLGVLRNTKSSKMYRQIAQLPLQARRLALSKDDILTMSKTRTRSTIHRPAYTDSIGIKEFDANGKFIRERRFIGLFTSAAYSRNPREIPLLRQKVLSVLKMSGLPYKSHAGKDLMHILTNFPRDDLFHATVEELWDISAGILHIQNRRVIRLFIREDSYLRFVTCLLYLPKENFNTDVLNHSQEILIHAFDGLEAEFSTHFTETDLAWIHFVIRVNPAKKLVYDVKAIEQRLIKVCKSWHDSLNEATWRYFGEERGNYLLNRYQNAFPAGYREVFSAEMAIHDIEQMEKLSPDRLLEMTFYRPLGERSGVIKFKLYREHATVPLSDALPMLENMGLRVIGEVPYKITFVDGREIWINDFIMTYAAEPNFVVEEVKDIFQNAFFHIWHGDAESDKFNRLVLEAQLNWREISILRAYTKYLRQAGITFSVDYIAETFVKNAIIARLVIDMFKCLFDPEIAPHSQQRAKELKAILLERLEEVSVLDEDRIIRRVLDLIQATLRTNYYQRTGDGKIKPYLSFKFNPKKVRELPPPLPRYEIFVYSPLFEGVHLRSAKVARGGIRWSDRREDFRTEILGLMKAQKVKNAVIVPSGAKGGFVPKAIPVDKTREEIIAYVIACYSDFIRGLLDLTDNLVADKVVHPENTVLYDGDDTYLVVAADKGTATFSDIANQIAIERNYWLGDAFASGSSTGYDHKKMGITARGAWVSAERHFQEFGINVDQTEITVVGIGDMAGDVFGNGLLLSNKIKCVAAFNHQHIFLDPNPDPQMSFEERKRLFNLPRSTWDDYNKDLISKGGGVFLRSAKAIKLSQEVKELLEISKDSLIPNDLVQAILRAKVDMIWNGGIGTFVKASSESHDAAVDRTNDSIRINGNELRARVVCEGGNLGLTQLARIEYELNGGSINTDFIDNSAGVDCSDHEVNIKILLNAVVADGKMTPSARNKLLQTMTNEVAELVLQDNYSQNQTISLAKSTSPYHMTLYIRYIEACEQTKKLDRALEFLPETKAMLERKTAGQGLTRPELSVLLAYSKIILKEQIRKSDLTSDPFLKEFIREAFPTPLRKRYGQYLEQHRLRREIVSTQLSNHTVSHMGITFVYQMVDETGASVSQIVRAYVAVYHIFHMEEICADIESLDYKVDAKIQHQIMDDAVRLVRRATRWLLRNCRGTLDIEKTIKHFGEPVANLFRRLPKLLRGGHRERFEQRYNHLISVNIPEDIAWKIASAEIMYHVLNIIEAATTYKTDVYQVARIYFILVDKLDLLWFRDQVNAFSVDDRWSVLARAAYKGDLDWIQRELTKGVLTLDVHVKNIPSRINAWFERYKTLVERWQELLADLRSAPTRDFAMLSVAIRELADLAQIHMVHVE